MRASFLLVALWILASSPMLARAELAQGETQETARTASLSAPEATTDLLDDAEEVDPWERWFEEVEPLISTAEKRLFLSLTADYQREAFVERFWRVRDPYTRTARNELKERWPLSVAAARSRYPSLTDDRARMLMVHGEPDAKLIVECTRYRKPLEVWQYRGTPWVDIEALVIFRVPRTGDSRIWQPSVGTYDLVQTLQSCQGGAEVEPLLLTIDRDPTEYNQDLRRLLAKPRPRSLEWVDSFAAYTTDLPDDATPLAGELELAFPGRHQHRTVVQGLLRLDRSALEASDFAGHRSYEVRMVGEVLRDGQLFESFRYRFGFPADVDDGADVDESEDSTEFSSTEISSIQASSSRTLPLGFRRFLRPGDYQLILRVDDLGGDGVLRIERPLTVPRADEIVEMPTFRDPETEAIFAEAAAALATGTDQIRIVPPRAALLTGFTRFDTLVTGQRIERVRFLVDERPVATKNRPPYSIEIDLGTYPDLRSLRVEGLDRDGVEIAADDLLINSGGYRFVAKLREPRPGKRPVGTIEARVEIEVPEGRTVERVELYVDEQLAATLYQKPWSHPITLTGSADDVGYVRAVAYLTDGHSTEDLVLLGAVGETESVEVQLVELYTRALGTRGRPVEDLRRDEVKVLEDGVAQTIRRFETVDDQPIHVGIVLDSSASMAPVIDDVRRAALDFVESTIESRDRVALIPFNNGPRLAVELTSERQAIGAGLAGLSAEGRTALYDSIMFGLYYLTGVRGQRALLVLSDGRDESSRFGFEETLDYARRAGITLYTVGLRLDDAVARRRLDRLAEETGGRSFFLRSVDELSDAYTTIRRELRSQLLIAYQSSNSEDDGLFRQVEVEISRPGVEAKTISGYYP